MFVLTNRPSKRFRTYESVVLDILNTHQSYYTKETVSRPIILGMCIKPITLEYHWYRAMFHTLAIPGPNVQLWQDEHGYWRHSTDAVAAATKPLASPFQKAFKIKER